MAVDIVIPLSKQSRHQNMELRLALRSIDKYAKNAGNIWIYTEADLSDFQNINVVKMADKVKDNKDANLITKIKAAAENPDVSDKFMFWSDDQVLMDTLDLEQAPVVYNMRNIKALLNQPMTKWRKRLLNTMNYVQKQIGIAMRYNYDSHTPQPYTKQNAKYVFNTVPYMTQPGFCINTIYYGMLGQPGNASQETVKFTVEGPLQGIPKNRFTYFGYDDQGFNSGVNCFLIGYLFDKCKYQK